MVMVAVAVSSLHPGVPIAAPATKEPAPDMAAFDQGFRKGQDEFTIRRYVSAARIWIGAAQQLPEVEEHKENRRAIYEYIAEAYEKALDEVADEALMREGLAALDAYAETFTAAYPSETLPEHVVKAQLAFRTRLAESEAERQERENLSKPQEQPALPPTPAPSDQIKPLSKPWKGLAIGGGIAVAGGAAMLGMFAAGLAGAKSAESWVEDNCNVDLVGECANMDREGKTSNAIGVAGIVAGPLLLGAGITMLVIAMRRKKSSKMIAPMFSPSMAGLVWQQRF